MMTAELRVLPPAAKYLKKLKDKNLKTSRRILVTSVVSKPAFRFNTLHTASCSSFPFFGFLFFLPASCFPLLSGDKPYNI